MNAFAFRETGRSRAQVFSVPTELLTMAALLLLASCSKPGSTGTSSSPAASSTSSAASSGPCSLITQADAESVLGKGATINATHNPRTGMDECRVKPGSAPGIEDIIILVHPAVGWDMVKKSLMEKPAPGLGDDAFSGRFIGYNVRKGNKYVQVFGPLTNDAAANDKATRALAERAASRL